MYGFRVLQLPKPKKTLKLRLLTLQEQQGLDSRTLHKGRSLTQAISGTPKLQQAQLCYLFFLFLSSDVEFSQKKQGACEGRYKTCQRILDESALSDAGQLAA